MAIRTAHIVPPLGDLMTVEVDPSWPHVDDFLEGNPIGTKLSFAFVDLDAAGITEDMQPNYADTDVVGRAEQYKTFVGASNREYTLSFKFQAQGYSAAPGYPFGFNPAVVSAIRDIAAQQQQARPNGGNTTGRKLLTSAVAGVLLKEVINPAMWMEALKHPIIGAGELQFAPPPVLLTVGRLIPTSRCIVTNSTLTWMPPFDPETLLPFQAEVQTTFTVVRTKIEKNLFLHNRQYR